MRIEIKLKERTKKWLKKYPEIFHKRARKAMELSLMRLKQETDKSFSRGQTSAKKLKSVTGTLKGSIKASPISETSYGYKGTVGTNVIYSAIHEYGGIIRPTSKEFLHFIGRGGKHVFAKSVTMPERSFLRSAINNSSVRDIKKIILNTVAGDN